MSVVAEALSSTESTRYGRFSRRLQAALIDFIIIVVSMCAAIFLAIALNSESLTRPLGFSIAAGWLLYEPLLVSFTGSTIGHYLCNLRVVDRHTGGNVNFLKAVAHTVIKALLSWVSFITMATTRRHQAVHDLLTYSTVQVRNGAMASPGESVGEYLELTNPNMPSRLRRVFVIMLYLIGAFVLLVITTAIASDAGLFSAACLDRGACRPNETALLAALSLVWMGLSILCIIFGWRGRLFGARIRRTPL